VDEWITLAALLSWAWVAITIEVDNAVEALHRSGSDVDSSRRVRLTPSGVAALDVHRERASRTQNEDLRSRLDALLAQRESLVAGLVPPEGCWRGDKPYLAQTRRVLDKPTAALPWHPMVLHRGGWPDGS